MQYYTQSEITKIYPCDQQEYQLCVHFLHRLFNLLNISFLEFAFRKPHGGSADVKNKHIDIIESGFSWCRHSIQIKNSSFSCIYFHKIMKVFSRKTTCADPKSKFKKMMEKFVCCGWWNIDYNYLHLLSNALISIFYWNGLHNIDGKSGLK